MVHTLTSSPTFTVYDVLEGEKEGERLPAETLRLERFALLEAEDDGFVTEIDVEAALVDSKLKFISYILDVVAVTVVFPMPTASKVAVHDNVEFPCSSAID